MQARSRGKTRNLILQDRDGGTVHSRPTNDRQKCPLSPSAASSSRQMMTATLLPRSSHAIAFANPRFLAPLLLLFFFLFTGLSSSRSLSGCSPFFFFFFFFFFPGRPRPEHASRRKTKHRQSLLSGTGRAHAVGTLTFLHLPQLAIFHSEVSGTHSSWVGGPAACS